MAETYSINQLGTRADQTQDAKNVVVPDSVAISLGAFQLAARLGAAQLYKGQDGQLFLATPDVSGTTFLPNSITGFSCKPGVSN